jgi:acetyl esterase/lipase
MRSVFIGYFLGALTVFLLFVVAQQLVIRDSAQDFNYRFIAYVFSDNKFPWGHLDQARVITRFLFPVKVTITYYDAQYNEVTEADKPGRYGAVVRIGLNGGVVEHQFITLYRMPSKVFLSDGPMKVTAQIPPGTGVDPVVLSNQSQQIGDAIKNAFCGDGDVSPDLAILLAGLSETSPTDPPAVQRTNVYARDAEWWFGLRQRLGLIQPYHYLLDLPAGYDADPSKRWPLILYLHGGAQIGSDLKMVRQSGLAGVIARGRQIPAIVVSPQLPFTEGTWNPGTLRQLLDDVSAKYRVDSDRIYLTGISGGGDAVWQLAELDPDRYAAIVTVAGEGDPADAARIKNIPTWVFQGEKDVIVPPAQVIGMVNALHQAGGHPHLTLFPNAGHGDAWDLTYATDALYPWMLAQKRGQPEVLTPGLPTP